MKNMIKNETKDSKPIKLGIIIGGGSGKVLSQVFHDFFNSTVAYYAPNKEVQWYIPGKNRILHFKNTEGRDFVADTKDQDVYGSYELIKQRGEKRAKKSNGKTVTGEIQSISEDEAKRLHRHYVHLYREENVHTIFRTSINAEALYQLRCKTGAIKGIMLHKDDLDQYGSVAFSKNVLLVRDQSQGYYANDNFSIQNAGTAQERINFTGHYSKPQIAEVIAFCKKRATAQFKDQSYELWASYKHHLFGNLIESWINDIDPNIKIYQPDTGFNKLIDFLNNKVKEGGKKQQTADNLIFLCSNEIGDLLYEPFTEILKNTGEKIDTYSRSFFTAYPFKGDFVEYQTVHGSVDDIAGAIGRDFTMYSEASANLMPFATIRCAANVAAEKLNLPGFQLAVDKAVAKTKVHFLLNPGPKNIVEILNHVWAQVKLIYPIPILNDTHHENQNDIITGITS